MGCVAVLPSPTIAMVTRPQLIHGVHCQFEWMKGLSRPWCLRARWHDGVLCPPWINTATTETSACVSASFFLILNGSFPNIIHCFSGMRACQEVTSHRSWSRPSCPGYAALSHWSERSSLRCLMPLWSGVSMKGSFTSAVHRTGRPWAVTSGSNSALRYRAKHTQKRIYLKECLQVLVLGYQSTSHVEGFPFFNSNYFGSGWLISWFVELGAGDTPYKMCSGATPP